MTRRDPQRRRRPLAGLARLADVVAAKGIRVASDQEAEACDAVVCMRVADMPVAAFPDDIITDCALGCGFRIRHRPHAPATPMKICAHCALGFVTEPRQ